MNIFSIDPYDPIILVGDRHYKGCRLSQVALFERHLKLIDMRWFVFEFENRYCGSEFRCHHGRRLQFPLD